VAVDLLDRIRTGRPMPAGRYVVRQRHAWFTPKCVEVLVDDEQVGAWSRNRDAGEGGVSYVLAGLDGAEVLTARLRRLSAAPQGNLPAAISDADGHLVGHISHQYSVLEWRQAFLVRDSAAAELARFKIRRGKLITLDGSIEIRHRLVPTGKGTVPAIERTLTASREVPPPLAALLLATPFTLMIHGADREPGDPLSAKERWGSISDGLSGLGNIG
jgi:hypothetical protein